MTDENPETPVDPMALVDALRYRQRIEDHKVYVLLELPLPSPKEMREKLLAMGAPPEEVEHLVKEETQQDFDVHGLEALDALAHLYARLEPLVQMQQVLAMGKMFGFDLKDIPK